jgi:hypothetical protein
LGTPWNNVPKSNGCTAVTTINGTTVPWAAPLATSWAKLVANEQTKNNPTTIKIIRDDCSLVCLILIFPSRALFSTLFIDFIFMMSAK